MMKEKKEEMIREQPLTYDDYAELPEDGNRYELVDGFLELMTPSATSNHQLVSHQLVYKITQSCEEEYIILHAPIDIIFSNTEVRQPDLLMIHRNRLSIITKRGVEGSPDLVIEILSPSSIKRDRQSKMKTYATYSIPEYWIVDPSNQILEQYVLNEHAYELNEVYAGDETINSEHIQCVAFTMNEIMSRIPDIPD